MDGFNYQIYIGLEPCLEDNPKNRKWFANTVGVSPIIHGMSLVPREIHPWRFLKDPHTSPCNPSWYSHFWWKKCFKVKINLLAGFSLFVHKFSIVFPEIQENDSHPLIFFSTAQERKWLQEASGFMVPWQPGNFDVFLLGSSISLDWLKDLAGKSSLETIVFPIKYRDFQLKLPLKPIQWLCSNPQNVH